MTFNIGTNSLSQAPTYRRAIHLEPADLLGRDLRVITWKRADKHLKGLEGFWWMMQRSQITNFHFCFLSLFNNMINYTIISEKLVTATTQPPAFSCYPKEMIKFFWSYELASLLLPPVMIFRERTVLSFKEKKKKPTEILQSAASIAIKKWQPVREQEDTCYFCILLNR